MKSVANVAFVGCGTHSTNNLYPMLKYARCRLQSVCDTERPLAERNAQVFGARTVYSDIDKMLDEQELDGVLLCGPAGMHYELGKKVLKRGLALFVEKPTAPDLAKAAELVQLARANRTFVMTGFMKRFALTYGFLRQQIRAGEFAPSSAFIRYTHWPSPQSNLRSMMMYMSIHPIDLAISFFGEVKEVSSAAYEAHSALSLALTLRFRGGQWAQLMLGCHGPRIQEHVEITGLIGPKHGYYCVDNIHHMELHTAGQSGTDLNPALSLIGPKFELDDIKTWRPDYGIPNMAQNSTFAGGYAGEIREFADAILEKRIPDAGNEDGLRAFRVLEAVVANPNRTVALD